MRHRGANQRNRPHLVQPERRPRYRSSWIVVVAALATLLAACEATPPSNGSGLRPHVTSSQPADGATEVPRDSAVRAFYVADAPLQEASIDAESVRLVRTEDDVPVSAAVELDETDAGLAIVVTPHALLAAAEEYRFRISDDVTDADGRAFVPFEASFTTATDTGEEGAPRITGAEPADGATGVLRDAELRAFYAADVPLDASTVDADSVLLTRTSDGASVASSVSLSNAGEAAIVVAPDLPLAPNAEYRLRVTDTALDQNGQSFEPFEATFTTSKEFEQQDRPYVTGSDPSDGETDVYLDTAVTTILKKEGVPGVDDSTTGADTVLLYPAGGDPVSGSIVVSGGRDSIIFQPDAALQANTTYVFEITEDVEDLDGNAFQPYRIDFTTGEDFEAEPEDVAFTREQVYDGASIASLAIGPDGWLYGAGLRGTLFRWPILSDGSLDLAQGEFNTELDGRTLIGLTFDPDDPNVLWLTHNAPLTNEDADDFTGAIARVTLGGGTLATASFEDVVVGLPRSTKDHMTNSLAFGPDGALYVTQGSNTGAGAPDDFWGNRQERLLTAAVLRVDTDAIVDPPLDVQTEDYGGEQGDYDPEAGGAPVTIYATGLRNAYDLVWHSNGELYVPTNGGNGGNAPSSPDGHPQDVPALEGVSPLPDYLFRVREGRYYGHPNVLRDEYVLNGGNPTSAPDPAEVAPVNDFDGYPVGISPDPNYDFFVEEFCCNDSINGAIEYTNGAFAGALQEKLLIVRYAAGGDLVAVELDGAGDSLGSTQVAAGFENPLDVVEDAAGNLYVAELPSWSDGRIQLLRVGN